MASSVELCAQFNRALLDFIRDLAQSFPQVEGFRRAYASTNLMATFNPSMVQTVFHNYASKYMDKILKHDDTFFLDKDFSEEAAAAGESIEIVSTIKTIWRSLDQANKDNIWRHMEVLVATSHTVEMAKAGKTT